ncbi:MAG TPA: acetate--CoA ligase family protein [Mycobacteriales bacterium]|nr:acetate--CoA ligase family protein [Mycobacteriales bacterium]
MTIAPARAAVEVDALFDVGAVAVVGASPGKHYSASVLRNLVHHGVPAEHVYAVNPRYSDVDGLRCYPDLAALPERPSLVVSVVGGKLVDGVLDQVIAVGVRAMLVIADGYSEQGAEGSARQLALARKAAAAGVALLGPNSLGYAAPARGIGAWVGGTLPDLTAGNVALAFQSSGMLNLVMNQVSERRIGISGAISVGNEAVLDVADFVRHYASDVDTAVIGTVLESTTRPSELAAALLAASAAGKVLVVLSIGKSERGMLNAASHAGRMATGSAVWDALYRQVGAVVVDDLSDFLDTIALAGGIPVGTDVTGLALATISGGDCGMLSDMADALGLELAPVTPATQAELDDALSRDGILPNPLDVRNTRTSAPEVFRRSLTALAADENVAVVGLRMNLAPAPAPWHEQMYATLAALVRDAGAECVFMSRVHETSDPAWYELFHRLGTPFLTSYGGALGAFRHLQQRPSVAGEAGFPAVPAAPEPVAVGTVLDWTGTTQWLRKWDLPYVGSALAESTVDAVARADELGYPVVLKGVVSGLAHKSEHQLVELGIATPPDAAAAADRLLAKARVLGDGAAIEVQAMVGGGAEFFLGMHRDPILGPIVSFGLGGIFLEILHDVVYALPPVTEDQVLALLHELKGWALLAGARGQQPRDVAALATLVSRFSEAVAADDVTAVDLNPVMVFPAGGGVLAVDAYVERKGVDVAVQH